MILASLSASLIDSTGKYIGDDPAAQAQLTTGQQVALANEHSQALTIGFLGLAASIAAAVIVKNKTDSNWLGFAGFLGAGAAVQLGWMFFHKPALSVE